MPTDVKPKPIPWSDVAIVVFDGEKPIIITSAEPRVLFDTFQSLVEDEEDSDSLWGENRDERGKKVLKMIESYRWELHPLEQAKQIFCNNYEG